MAGVLKKYRGQLLGILQQKTVFYFILTAEGLT
jgi:hypothetical protein